MSYADDRYYGGFSDGYDTGKRHGLHLLEGERAHNQILVESLKDVITERDATIKGLQQSLDEATARINSFESAKKPPFKVGDKVKSKSNMAVRYYTVRTINRDGTLNVQSPSGGMYYGMYYGQPADGFIPLETFNVGERVQAKRAPGIYFTVIEVENGVLKLRGVRSGITYSGLPAKQYELAE